MENRREVRWVRTTNQVQPGEVAEMMTARCPFCEALITGSIEGYVMRAVASLEIFLLLLLAGCASWTPPDPQERIKAIYTNEKCPISGSSENNFALCRSMALEVYKTDRQLTGGGRGGRR